MNLARVMLASFLIGSVAACGDAHDDSGRDESIDQELRTTTITKLHVSSLFESGANSGDCYTRGAWFVDLEAKKLDGNACLDGDNFDVNRSLSTQEVAEIRAHVAAIRTTGRPRRCNVDIPVNSMTIERGARSTRYVDARASCRGGVAVKEDGLADLVLFLQELSAPAAEQQ
jgi:hypothetical protein